MRIDVHAHYHHSEFVSLIERMGGDVTAVRRTQLSGEHQRDLEARLQMMDRAGVDMQILSVSSLFPYFDREADGVEAARFTNDIYAELVARYPKRFRAFAVAPLPHVDAALKEVERGLDQLEMVGVTVGTSVMSRSSVSEALEPFYAELNRRGAVVFVHPAGLGLCSPLLNDHALTWPIGAPFEDTMFATHVIRRRILDRFPKLKIIVPHLGGALPMLLDRLEMTRPGFAPDSEPVAKVARRMWYDTVAQGNTAALRCACEKLGADRLVHGSDYPYQIHKEYLRSVTYVQEAGLAPGDAERILDRNAAELLGLAS